MSKGFVVAEQGHIVTLFDPQSQSAALTSDTFIMENWAHATLIFQFGAGSGTTITVGECTSFAGSGRTAITFRYASEATHAGDVFDAALAWASSITVAAGTGSTHIIEIDADELSNASPYIQANLADPGTSKVVSGLVILSGGRYTEDITATAIA